MAHAIQPPQDSRVLIVSSTIFTHFLMEKRERGPFYIPSPFWSFCRTRVGECILGSLQVVLIRPPNWDDWVRPAEGSCFVFDWGTCGSPDCGFTGVSIGSKTTLLSHSIRRTSMVLPSPRIQVSTPLSGVPEPALSDLPGGVSTTGMVTELRAFCTSVSGIRKLQSNLPG